MPSNLLERTNTHGSEISKIFAKFNKPEKNFAEILDDLYFYGKDLTETRVNTLSAEEKSSFKKGKKIISLKRDEGFRAQITRSLKQDKESQDASQDDSDKSTQDLSLSVLGLQKLSCLMTAWADPYFRGRDENADTVPSILYQRQNHKNKRLIDKSARHAIHAALFAICQAVNPESDLDPKESIEEYLQQLASLHAEPAQVLDNEAGASLDENGVTAGPNTQKSQEAAQQSAALLGEMEELEYLQSAEQALAAYRSPTKKNRAIQISSIVLAIIIGLTAGLATGGAIYLLIPTLPIWGAALIAAAIFAVGFHSNYSFFSETLPAFFHMIGRGELTQYFDKKTGQRKKMGWFKKCLLGLAFIFALSVGLVSAALLVGAIMALAAALFPAVGATVPLIIGGVLGLFYGICLTITMFYAFVKAIKDPPSFSEIKAWFKNLTVRQVLGLVIKGAVSALVLFGIGFGCQVSIAPLSQLLNGALPFISVPVIAALSRGLAIVSFIGQVPFAVLSVNKFCNSIADLVSNLFHSKDYQKLESASVGQQKPNHLFSKVLAYVSLLLNAAGNAVLVFVPGSNPSKVAAVGAGFYSFAGNMPEPQGDEQRQKASEYSFKLIQNAGLTSTSRPCQEERKPSDPISIPVSAQSARVNSCYSSESEYDTASSTSSLFMSDRSSSYGSPQNHDLLLLRPENDAAVRMSSARGVSHLPSSSHGFRQKHDLHAPEEDNCSKRMSLSNQYN